MIGTGIFTTTGFLAGDLGSPSLVLLAWVVGAVCALLGAVSYAELALNLPSSGGEYLYLSQAYGPTWGFITGWVSLLAGFSGPIAATALAFAGYLAFFFPNWQHAEFGTSFTFRFGTQQLIACILVAVFSAWNCFGIRASAPLQNVLTGAKVLLLSTFILSGFLLGHGDWHNFSLSATRWSGAPVWQEFAVSLFWIYVSYSGWNAAVYVAEEIERPERTLPRALAIGSGVVAVLYFSLNLIFIYATALESMKGVVAIGAFAASRLFGRQMAGAFSALMAFLLLSTINAMTIAGPRVYYAMARDGHFFSSAAKIHARWHTPVNSILAQAICTMVLVLTPFPQLVVYIGFTLNLFAVMSVASLLMFRQRPGWRTLRIVSFAYPLIPCLFITVGMWMIIEGLFLKPIISLLTVLTIVTGALLHRLTFGSARSRYTPNWFKGGQR
jgi:APA family basic amino acid/polyamine antiporter